MSFFLLFDADSVNLMEREEGSELEIDSDELVDISFFEEECCAEGWELGIVVTTEIKVDCCTNGIFVTGSKLVLLSGRRTQGVE
jgi:hypothetical protein